MENSSEPLNTKDGFQNRDVEKSKPRLGKRIRKYFRDYCDGSSLIGFRYLSERRSRGERYLWFFIVALSIALSVYYVMEIYKKYVENPFIVHLATRESPIYVIPFPAVTICPKVKTSKSDFNFTGTVNRLWDNETISEDDIRYTQYFSLLCDNMDDSYIDLLPQNTTFTEDFFESLGELHPPLRKFFGMCQLMGKEIDCSDLFEPVIVDDGICFTFNMLNRKDIYKPDVVYYSDYLERPKRTNWTIDDGYPEGTDTREYPYRGFLAGADNALSILLVQGIGETDYLCLQDTVGFSVLLHTPQTVPQLKKSYFSVPLDKSVQAIIKPTMMTTSKEVKNYKIKDRKCYFTKERYLRYFDTYTPENCQLECLANFTMRQCNCVNYFMPRDNTTNICGNAMKHCMNTAEFMMKVEEIKSHMSEDYPTADSCNCMPTCTSLKYEVDTSRTPFPWQKMFKAEKRMAKYLDAVELEETLHFSLLKIYFGSDMFIQMERTELYGFFDLMSNIGGILGLFNGFALLSVIEIVYYMTVRLWCNYRLNNDLLES